MRGAFRVVSLVPRCFRRGVLNSGYLAVGITAAEDVWCITINRCYPHQLGSIVPGIESCELVRTLVENRRYGSRLPRCLHPGRDQRPWNTVIQRSGDRGTPSTAGQAVNLRW